MKLLKDLFLFRDACNVYVLKMGDRAAAIDFGQGSWIRNLPSIGVRRLEHVFLTHHHEDQCSGLTRRRKPPFQVHAPAAERPYLDPPAVERYWQTRGTGGCPPSYSVLRRGLPQVDYEMAEAADFFWRDLRIRFLPTPGHGQGAHSVFVSWCGKQIVFCGDAAHAGATIHEPYHLEWDHWTGAGALQAWAGVRRLYDCGMDMLCPSHGPVIDEQPRRVLRQLLTKIMRLYEVKGSVCPGEHDDYWTTTEVATGIRQVLPSLYQFGNAYLLRSKSGEGLVFDLMAHQRDALDLVMERAGCEKLTAATASHFHSDHTDGLPLARDGYGAEVVLHPWVAEPIGKHDRYDVPWLPTFDIRADRLLPERGLWRWNEFAFSVAPLPAQTWWHAGFLTEIDGVRVLFSGDNFQPPSRWNGTGGFCSFNGSRFEDGFAASARQVMRWKPDLICNGHNCQYRYHASHYRKIIAWSRRAEKAIRNLCPSGDIERDYVMHHLPDIKRRTWKKR